MSTTQTQTATLTFAPMSDIGLMVKRAMAQDSASHHLCVAVRGEFDGDRELFMPGWPRRMRVRRTSGTRLSRSGSVTRRRGSDATGPQ